MELNTADDIFSSEHVKFQPLYLHKIFSTRNFTEVLQTNAFDGGLM